MAGALSLTGFKHLAMSLISPVQATQNVPATLFYLTKITVYTRLTPNVLIILHINTSCSTSFPKKDPGYEVASCLPLKLPNIN